MAVADTLERDHIDAARAALFAADPTLAVYPDAEGNVPTAPAPSPPYVRWYSTIERPIGGTGDALDGRSVTWTTRWYLHCVGENEYAAIAVAMRVRSALLNARPSITGRACGFIQQEAASPTTRDESTGEPVYDQAVVYAMVSTPG